MGPTPADPGGSLGIPAAVGGGVVGVKSDATHGEDKASLLCVCVYVLTKLRKSLDCSPLQHRRLLYWEDGL